jgi:hypothetical protein
VGRHRQGHHHRHHQTVNGGSSPFQFFDILTVPDIRDLNLWSEKSIEKRYNIEKSHLKNVTEVLKTPLKNVLNI